MLVVFTLLALVVNINAHFHTGGYGYYGFNYGLKKGGIGPYNAPHIPPVYGTHGFQYGYRTPHTNFYYNKPYFVKVKRLPPIIKNVKQPVYVEQPIIINKIPVYHKKEEVIVKKLPPIYDTKHKTTVVKKGAGVDVIPGIDKMPVIPEEVVGQDKSVYKGSGVDVMHAVEHMPKAPEEVIGHPMGADGAKEIDKMPPVDLDMMYDLDKRTKGNDDEIIKEMEVMKAVKEIEPMKDVKPMVDMKDGDFGDYNSKDFDTQY